jgi:hypothetical protein
MEERRKKQKEMVQEAERISSNASGLLELETLRGRAY